MFVTGGGKRRSRGLGKGNITRDGSCGSRREDDLGGVHLRITQRETFWPNGFGLFVVSFWDYLDY